MCPGRSGGPVRRRHGEFAHRPLASPAGTYVRHIPYRGAAPALQDVLSGQADFVCDPGIAFPHIRTGKVKLLGVVSAKRSPLQQAAAR